MYDQCAKIWILITIQQVTIEVCQTSQANASRGSDDEHETHLIDRVIEVRLQLR